MASTGVQPPPSRALRNVTLFLCFLGMCISVFAMYIEIMKEKNSNYVAFCDINSYVTCSRALTSRYSKGFGLVEKIFSKTSLLNQPNTVYGMAFYTFMATLAISSSSSSAVVQFVASVLSNVGSVYLGYILFFILEDLCMVCLSTYVVNFLLLVASVVKLRRTASSDIEVTKKKKK
ncbi:vitamin K epoxide reductase complex subunit 1-like protein 1 [Plakobranchus ocellatus]|uniref:vitamin-K-epoxide reductase (warfarin-sensitive) n=1 Tax=Plakobranchus ocellatus TaxID=259542 RepID=A0AAV4C667_9GAST|nr:vitamin K epoxide reductase complex subunit 1-like protein 1 [Plakobranchus ocellatus]